MKLLPSLMLISLCSWRTPVTDLAVLANKEISVREEPGEASRFYFHCPSKTLPSLTQQVLEAGATEAAAASRQVRDAGRYGTPGYILEEDMDMVQFRLT